MSLEQIQRRRKAVSTIHDIVSAMRAIAAGRIQGAQRALGIAREYEQVVMESLAALAPEAGGRLLPAVVGRPPLLVVFTSEQPLCGSFNQDIVALAESRWSALCQQGPAHLIVVGQRGLRLLMSHGVVPEVSEPAATSVQGLRDLVKRLARMIDQRYARGDVGPLHVLYSRYKTVSEQVPTEECLLPLDLATLSSQGFSERIRHQRFLSVPDLLAGLISEYAFVSLYRVAADSFAGEQASRLVAMDSATRNTDRLRSAILDLERRERQGQITSQVLELIGARFAAIDLP